MYDLLNMLSVLSILIFNLLNFKQKKQIKSNFSEYLLNNIENISGKKTLSLENTFIVIEIVLISAAQYAPAPFLNTKFSEIVNTNMNYFGLIFFVPFILFAVFYLISINPFKQMDLITPAFPLALIFAKLGCFCAGCCHGIEHPYGLYNHAYNTVNFPVQLVEAGLALLLFVFLMFYRKKAKEGTLFPTYLILYSSTRFFSEFLRIEENVVWNLKAYQIICITGVIAGLIELLIVKKCKDKIIGLYDRSPFFEKAGKHIINYLLKNGIIKEKNIVHRKKRNR